MNQQYGIKEGYRANTPDTSRAVNEGELFWTPKRVQDSMVYQYHVYAWCRKIIQKKQFRSVMDLGCGPALKSCRMFGPLVDRLKLVDQAGVEDLIHKNHPQADFFEMDLNDAGVDLGESFDLVVCADVIEHLLDPDRCLDFIRRHLNEGGMAVISTPERDIVRGPNCTACPKNEHVREWNRREFAGYLNSRGFKVVAHGCLPQAKLGWFEYLQSRLLWKWASGRRPKWAGCQTVVCVKDQASV